MLQVQLKPGIKGGQWAYLRPLCGHDEVVAQEVMVHGRGMNGAGVLGGALEGTSSLGTALLDRLLVSVPGTTVASGRAKELAVCDCDRLFAHLYLTYFGEQIESNVTCKVCGEPFELGFSLRQLMARFEANAFTQVTGPDGEGIYTLADGQRFRLPTAGDRDSVVGLDTEQATTALLKRCTVEGDPLADTAALQSAMDEVGPVMDVDLDATCPHCQTAQLVQFDIQTYFLRALAFEHRFLIREVHKIAIAYGWSHQEILSLPREERQTFVRLIEAERPRRRAS
ncbi:MAG: hypothetical protein AAGC93_27020 [Cyanobacteria bacterium P01_F01_bin.53]